MSLGFRPGRPMPAQEAALLELSSCSDMHMLELEDDGAGGGGAQSEPLGLAWGPHNSHGAEPHSQPQVNCEGLAKLNSTSGLSCSSRPSPPQRPGWEPSAASTSTSDSPSSVMSAMQAGSTHSRGNKAQLFMSRARSRLSSGSSGQATPGTATQEYCPPAPPGPAFPCVEEAAMSGTESPTASTLPSPALDASCNKASSTLEAMPSKKSSSASRRMHSLAQSLRKVARKLLSSTGSSEQKISKPKSEGGAQRPCTHPGSGGDSCDSCSAWPSEQGLATGNRAASGPLLHMPLSSQAISTAGLSPPTSLPLPQAMPIGAQPFRTSPLIRGASAPLHGGAAQARSWSSSQAQGIMLSSSTAYAAGSRDLLSLNSQDLGGSMEGDGSEVTSSVVLGPHASSLHGSASPSLVSSGGAVGPAAVAQATAQGFVPMGRLLQSGIMETLQLLEESVPKAAASSRKAAAAAAPGPAGTHGQLLAQPPAQLEAHEPLPSSQSRGDEQGNVASDQDQVQQHQQQQVGPDPAQRSGCSPERDQGSAVGAAQAAATPSSSPDPTSQPAPPKHEPAGVEEKEQRQGPWQASALSQGGGAAAAAAVAAAARAAAKKLIPALGSPHSPSPLWLATPASADEDTPMGQGGLHPQTLHLQHQGSSTFRSDATGAASEAAGGASPGSAAATAGAGAGAGAYGLGLSMGGPAHGPSASFAKELQAHRKEAQKGLAARMAALGEPTSREALISKLSTGSKGSMPSSNLPSFKELLDHAPLPAMSLTEARGSSGQQPGSCEDPLMATFDLADGLAQAALAAARASRSGGSHSSSHNGAAASLDLQPLPLPPLPEAAEPAPSSQLMFGPRQQQQALKPEEKREQEEQAPRSTPQLKQRQSAVVQAQAQAQGQGQAQEGLLPKRRSFDESRTSANRVRLAALGLPQAVAAATRSSPGVASTAAALFSSPVGSSLAAAITAMHSGGSGSAGGSGSFAGQRADPASAQDSVDGQHSISLRLSPALQQLSALHKTASGTGLDMMWAEMDSPGGAALSALQLAVIEAVSDEVTEDVIAGVSDGASAGMDAMQQQQQQQQFLLAMGSQGGGSNSDASSQPPSLNSPSSGVASLYTAFACQAMSLSMQQQQRSSPGITLVPASTSSPQPTTYFKAPARRAGSLDLGSGRRSSSNSRSAAPPAWPNFDVGSSSGSNSNTVAKAQGRSQSSGQFSLPAAATDPLFNEGIAPTPSSSSSSGGPLLQAVVAATQAAASTAARALLHTHHHGTGSSRGQELTFMTSQHSHGHSMPNAPSSSGPSNSTAASNLGSMCSSWPRSSSFPHRRLPGIVESEWEEEPAMEPLSAPPGSHLSKGSHPPFHKDNRHSHRSPHSHAHAHHHKHQHQPALANTDPEGDKPWPWAGHAAADGEQRHKPSEKPLSTSSMGGHASVPGHRHALSAEQVVIPSGSGSGRRHQRGMGLALGSLFGVK